MHHMQWSTSNEPVPEVQKEGGNAEKILRVRSLVWAFFILSTVYERNPV